MSYINVNIDDNLERRFRIKITEVLGGKRGDLKIAVEEAIEMWLASKVDEKKLSK